MSARRVARCTLGYLLGISAIVINGVGIEATIEFGLLFRRDSQYLLIGRYAVPEVLNQLDALVNG